MADETKTKIIIPRAGISTGEQQVRALDTRIGNIAIDAMGGICLLTADHGNAEQMVDPQTGGAYTAHTTNEVPLILVSEAHKGQSLQAGSLCDLAPTILALAGLPQPEEMTGQSLLQK